MTTGKIYIASKTILGITHPQHLYLVFDPDGDPTNGNEEIIRGGPGDDPVPTGLITLEVARSIGSSEDKFGLFDDYIDRNFTELDLGAVDAEDVWISMRDAAEALGTVVGDVSTTSVEYDAFGFNSNSVVRTILYQSGIDFTTPQWGGTGDPMSFSTFWGDTGMLGTAGNDTWDFSVVGAKAIHDQGGDDTYIIDFALDTDTTPPRIIVEAVDPGSNDEIIIRNADPGTVGVFRQLDGTLLVTVDGKVVASVPAQFAGDPLLENVHVVPTVGSPVDIPVDDPNDIPLFVPEALPAIVPEAGLPWDQAPDAASPLVLDLDGDGIELTTFNTASTTSWFDIDGDNFAEQTAWITANQDGLLVRDLNDNARIDGADELFGSPTIDGFALLATLDDNGDHVIDQYDDAWADLLVWKDVNGDAATQSGELLTLASLNIASIDLAGVAASTSTISGNTISHTSTYKLDNGTTRSIVDAWFTHDDVRTYYTGDYTLDQGALFLPELRGFGKLPDLHIAMSIDEDLLEMVQDLAVSFSFDSFDPANGWNEAVTDILFKWAGVDSVDPGSRGPYIDARKLEFLEEFFGDEFVQWGVFDNPFQAGGLLLNQSWTVLFENVRAQLMLQSGAGALFANEVTCNPFTGEIAGDMDLSQAAIVSLEGFATDTSVDTEEFWIEVARFLDATKGFENLTSTENGWLNSSIVATDAGLSWTGIKALVDIDNGGATINGTSGDDTLTGTAHGETIYGNGGADTLNAVAGDDELRGGTGNDTLNGGAGEDTLYGDDNNDVLDGGSGGDIVYGGSGNDTYVYASGNDVYYDVSGTETITLPSGITLGDVTFYRQEDDPAFVHSLFIVVGSLGTIELTDHFASSGNASPTIETLVFADTSTYDLATFSTLISYGGEGTDFISGGTGNRVDIIYGLGGDDNLYGGYGGNDTLDGGVGNDTLNGELGDDTYIASAGFDIIMEAGGTDVIQMPAGVSTGDISFLRLNSNPDDLQITVDGLGQIIVDNYFVSSIYAVEQVVTTSATITLTSMSIETIGASGNDSMYGITASASTNDIFDGREGNDTMQGASGNDTYYFSQGQDVVYETTGSTADVIKFREVWAPGDITVYRGGYQGRDLIFADTNGNTLTVGGHFYDSQNIVESAEFTSTTWTFSTMEIETRGTSGNDTLFDYSIGDASTDDLIYGYAGNDQLHGGAGTNEIHGGDGADYLFGGTGVDYLYGDDGADYLDSNAGNDILVGGAGADDMRSGADDDLLEGGSGNDAIRAGSGTDTVTYVHAAGGVTLDLDSGASNDGDGGADTYNLADIENATGSNYGDSITGDSSNNVLRGLDGNDTINGGGGNDVLSGGSGQDTITGSTGGDVFLFEAASAFINVDTVTDFNAGAGDKFDFHDILDSVFDPVQHAINQFVDIRNSGSDAIIAIDRDGAALTYGFTDVATVTGGAGLDETTLYNNGNLLAA